MKTSITLLCAVCAVTGLSTVPQAAAGPQSPCAPIADHPALQLTALLTLAEFQKATGLTDVVAVVGHKTSSYFCDLYFTLKSDTTSVVVLLDTHVNQVQPTPWPARKGPAATVSGVGDDAFYAASAGTLYFRKGSLAVALRSGTDRTPAHKWFLTLAQATALGKIVAAKL